MNRLLGVTLALLLAPVQVPAQDITRVYTRPLPPTREALERLNLKQAWRAYVPTDGRRDGLFSVQLADDQILVQTQSGSVVVLSSRDGTMLWYGRVGPVPYRVTHALAYNSESVFAVRGSFLYALNRKTGQVQWDYDLPNAPSATPAADEERIFMPLGTGVLSIFELPDLGTRKKKNAHPYAPQKPPESAAAVPSAAVVPSASASNPYGVSGISSPYATTPIFTSRPKPPLQPELLWDYRAAARLERTPLLTDNLMVLAGSDGTFFVASKFERQVPFSFRAAAPLAAPLGQHASLDFEMAYVPSTDFNVYALDAVRGRILWRFTGGAPILRKPEVTDEDLYVSAERAGLFRIGRMGGETIWRNREADRFLSANPKFVYAVDRTGLLLVLDRARGIQRATFDVRDFVVPISNEWTDRFYLASNDGLLLCLHDREYSMPVPTKTLPVKKPPADPKPADKKPEEGGDKPKGEGMDKPKAEMEKPKEKEN